MIKEENNFKFPNNVEAEKELKDLLFKAMEKCDRYNILPTIENEMLEMYEKNSDEPFLVIYYTPIKDFKDVLNFAFIDIDWTYHAEFKPKLTIEELAQMCETFIRNRNNNNN